MRGKADEYPYKCIDLDLDGMMCLAGWADRTGREGMIKMFVVVGLVQGIADFFSVIALLRLLSMPSPPAALAFGYWLTTAGCVAFFGGAAHIHIIGIAWTGEDGRRVVGWGTRLFSLLFGVFFAVQCSIPLSLLVLAPLQLSGVAHGLAPPCDAWPLCEVIAFLA